MLIFKSKINKMLLLPILGLWLACAVVRVINQKLPVWEDTPLCKGVYTQLCTIDFLKNSLLHLNCWDGFLPVLFLLMLLVSWFTWINCNYKKYLSSYILHKQLFGALIKAKLEHYIIPVILVVACLAYYSWRTGHYYFLRFCIVLSTTLILICVCRIAVSLNEIYSLRKQETKITWSQICLLTTFGVWIIVVIYCLNLHNANATIVAVVGAVLGWIFQDTIKSVAAFFYLRANNLLQIGDLITVPSKGIEGFVCTISLTTVTIENWDTTTSAFPTYILHAEHFKNSQRMMDGKTLGRLMQKTFIIDSGWTHPLTDDDIARLRNELDADEYFILKEVVSGKLNIEVFRLYIYHWLMNNQYVSQQPRLIVRWLEQTDKGMPLQLFAYLTDTMLDVFEWRQSQIMEHVIKALGWFDLQLYQSPSGYDASNSNIYLTQQSADYRKKTEDNAKLTEI